MKRSFMNIVNLGENEAVPPKVQLVERCPDPNGVALVNPLRTGKSSYTDAVELSQSTQHTNTFIQANAVNKLDIIGRQIKNLQELMGNVINESQLSIDLHNAACNFVKRPGSVYHLYQRPSGQKYFGMLSPDEWTDCPHTYLGSYRLESDQSWTKAGEEKNRLQGYHFLQALLPNMNLPTLMDSS